MAKRKQVDVDEDLIKSMMTGDIPRLKHVGAEENRDTEKETEREGPLPENPAYGQRKKETDTPSKIRRRREQKDYASLFLRMNTSAKRQTYVNADLYDKISKILGIIAKDISVPNFIDNVLENHLKEYRDEINEIYKDNVDLLL